MQGDCSSHSNLRTENGESFTNGAIEEIKKVIQVKIKPGESMRNKPSN